MGAGLLQKFSLSNDMLVSDFKALVAAVGNSGSFNVKGLLMQRLFSAALVLITSSSGSYGGEIQAASKVDAVTVFLSGAEVTRTAHITLEKGDHTIILKDLPATAVAGSIRVEGKATGKLDIGSVDTTRKFLQRAESQAADGERKTIEDELERLGDERLGIEGQVLAAETQKTLIANLAQLPIRPSPATAVGALPEDWSRVLSVIGQGTTEASRLHLEAQAKLRTIDRRIVDQQNKLASLVPAQTEQTEVRVYVAAASALEADLIVRYQVPNANWTPVYDARLITGTKTEQPKLEVARRAAITQRSGEGWENVTLALSTARPSEGAAAPSLDTQVIDFEAPPKPMPVAASRDDRLRQMKERKSVSEADGVTADAAAPEMTIAAVPEPAPIIEATAQVISAPFEATFSVPGKVSVVGSGEAKRVLLAGDTLEPILSSRTAPKVDSNAYLYATFKFATGTPLLPGQVYLFRDGTFVGTGQLPLLAPGVEHNLGFGVDDQVKVRHAVVEEIRGESGLISTSRVDNRKFKVTVKNLHDRPIDIAVLDRLPVSQNDEIKVEYIGSLTPTKQNVDDKRGVMRFDVRLEPDEERALEYGYRVSWPAAKSIIYGP